MTKVWQSVQSQTLVRVKPDFKKFSTKLLPDLSYTFAVLPSDEDFLHGYVDSISSDIFF